MKVQWLNHRREGSRHQTQYLKTEKNTHTSMEKHPVTYPWIHCKIILLERFAAWICVFFEPNILLGRRGKKNNKNPSDADLFFPCARATWVTWWIASNHQRRNAWCRGPGEGEICGRSRSGLGRLRFGETGGNKNKTAEDGWLTVKVCVNLLGEWDFLLKFRFFWI